MKTAFVYQRQSLQDISKQKHSIENQQAQLAQFAAAHGYAIERTFTDYARASSANRTRDALNGVLDALNTNKDAYLLLRDVTRLTRDIGDWNRLIKPYLARTRFANSGDRALTELEIGLLLVISHNESRVLGERISNGIANSRRRSESAGIPFKWGNYTESLRIKSLETRLRNADIYGQGIININQLLLDAGMLTLKSRVEAMQTMGYTSRRGALLTIKGLHRTLTRASNRGISSTMKGPKHG